MGREKSLALQEIDSSFSGLSYLRVATTLAEVLAHKQQIPTPFSVYHVSGMRKNIQKNLVLAPSK
jgi:hypothetical protein